MLHVTVVGAAFRWIFILRQPVDEHLPARIARHAGAALTSALQPLTRSARRS